MFVEPHKKNNKIWKEIAIATIPSLLALTLQKLLEEFFEFWKEKSPKKNNKCDCSDLESESDIQKNPEDAKTKNNKKN